MRTCVAEIVGNRNFLSLIGDEGGSKPGAHPSSVPSTNDINYRTRTMMLALFTDALPESTQALYIFSQFGVLSETYLATIFLFR